MHLNCRPGAARAMPSRSLSSISLGQLKLTENDIVSRSRKPNAAQKLFDVDRRDGSYCNRKTGANRARTSTSLLNF
jgi:hypothetical protein